MAYPDYKRPSVSTRTKFFANKAEAEEYVKDQKRKYYNDHSVKEDQIITSEEDPDSYDEIAEDIIYYDYYMDIVPFDAIIYNVHEELEKQKNKSL